MEVEVEVVLQILVGAVHCMAIDALEMVCSFVILQLPLHAALDLTSVDLQGKCDFMIL